MEDTQLIKRFDALENLIKHLGKTLQGQIDTLAAITGKNFIRLEERLDDMDERLGSKIAGVQRSVDVMYERHSELEARLSK